MEMISKISFINDHWFWPLIVCAAILLAVFLWKDFSRPITRRLPLKIILSVLAVASLVFIALKPALPVSGSGGKTVILTPGFQKDQVDSLKKEYQGSKIYDYNGKGYISKDILDSEMLFILGNGLPDYDLEQIKHLPTVFFPGTQPVGVIKLKFPERKKVGDNLDLHGVYRNPVSGHKLVLEGPGGIGLDSIDLENNEEQIFILTTDLKAAGDFVYHLAEKDPDGEILTSDPVAVKVEEKSKLKILIINNFPTFETRYLKNFLAESGHEIVVRSQITRGRYKYEFFNTKATETGNLSPALLRLYDLLIIDAPTFRLLTKAQSSNIVNSVREEGLGLFIQPDEGLFSNSGGLLKMGFRREGRTEVNLDIWPTTSLSVFPYSIERSTGLENIYRSENTEITGYHRYGRGRIGTSVLKDTWQLVLEGENQVYKSLWSHTLEQLSKREDEPVLWIPEASILYPHEPYNFRIRSSLNNPEITNSNGGIIPLKQDVNLPEIWSGKIWPREHGWNSLLLDTTSNFNFYVPEEGSWLSLRAQNTLAENRRFFGNPAESKVGHVQLYPIDPIWFYFLFLLCMGGLWLEPKLS